MADGNDRSAKGKEVVVDGEPDESPKTNGGAGGSAEPSHRWRGFHPSAGGTASVEPIIGPHDGYFSYGAGVSWMDGLGSTAGAVGWDTTITSAGSGSNGAASCGGGAVGWDAAAGTNGGVGSFGGSNGGGSSYGGRGGSRAVDWRGGGGGYGMDFLPENSGGSGGTNFPPPHMDTRMYVQAPYHAGPGYWPTGNGGGTPPPFPSPVIGAGIPGPHYAHTSNSWHTGVGSSAGHEFYRGNVGDGDGGGSATFPSPPYMGDGMSYAPYHAPPNSGRRRRRPLPWSRERFSDAIADSLRCLTIRDRGRGEGLLARGGRQLSDWVSHGLLNAAAADPYAGRGLDDVRGEMGSVARDLPGCRFLVRMVAQGGAAAARQVFNEVAGGIVRLMVDTVAHELVEALVEHWTDEQITRVLHILAASPDQIVMVARNNAGSNILETLIGRIAGNPGHAELFTGTLARAGERGVLSLIEHVDGSRFIMACLDAFPAHQNRFITAVVASRFLVHRVCRDKHGCRVVNRCIDLAAAAGDERLWKSLVLAVCVEVLALADDGYGNFVVQHVLASVPEAREHVHATFRRRYVSLSRQRASSHVVQSCLQHFSPAQADEIVGELLSCHSWGCTFPQLIADPFANYVLQSAVKRREIQMHSMLLEAINMHRNSLKDDRIAREFFRKLGRPYLR